MDWQVALAIKIAEKIHKGQFDKAGRPYIEHPGKVAEMVEKDKEKVVAYLHDVLEDSDTTLNDLKEYGFDYDVLKAVKVLTKSIDMNYSSYIEEIHKSGNSLAIAVKIADLRHNMDLTRLQKITMKDLKRQQKYLNALRVLIT